MPIFEYRGLNKAGKNVKGTVDADNARTARIKLKKDNVFVTDIRDKKKAESKKNQSAAKSKSVGIKDLALMTRQLAVLIKANIPLVDALAAVSEQVENPTLAESIADAKNMVNEGSSFHKALLKYPQIYTTIYVSMVEAGETAGNMDIILLRLADFTESQAQLREKVKSALTYPVIMLVIVGLVLMGLFVFVIPKMVVVFESFPELELPWYTTVLISDSQFMVSYWYFMFGGLALIYFLFLNWKRSPEGTRKWDAISLTLPVVGEITKMVAVARFTRTLSTLLTGGVPMIAALEIVKKVVGNCVIADAIEQARANISEGENIAGPLSKSGHFPPLVLHMVRIGEKTGELENMLTQVSDAYDFQVKSKLEGLTSAMTPIITVLMGLVVFIIVLSIVVPMFEMTNIGDV
ncbi:MAG: type II secretion system inner membrane protein GspF [Pseudobdellovibrionaceae bacterium]